MKKHLEKICKKYADHHFFSGVCRASQNDALIFEKAYGYANRAFLVPNTPQTKFDVASVGKIFTAAAVLLLVQQNKLQLDEYICDVIDLSNTKIPADVKIEHLLNHTSGIADDADEEAGEEYSDLFIDSPNYALRECKDFLKNFAHKPANFAAGTNVRYNNCAFVLLGLAIEKRNGLPYRQFVEKNIFAPCGMQNTAFCSMDAVCPVAEGYIQVLNQEGVCQGWKKNIYSYPPVGGPDGGVYTTPEDLERFLRTVQKGVLLLPPYSAAFLQPHCAFAKPYPWLKSANLQMRNGYGFEFLENEKGIFCMRKDGLNSGVAAMFSYYPQQDIVLAITANQDCNVWAMHREMQDVIFEKYYKQ